MGSEVRLFLPCDLGHLRRVHREARAFLERHGVASDRIYAAEVALEELVSNVVRHAYPEETSPDRGIIVGLAVRDGRAHLHVEDDGQPFDPSSAAVPDVSKPLEQWRAGGLGLHLTRQLVQELRYRRRQGCNRVEVTV